MASPRIGRKTPEVGALRIRDHRSIASRQRAGQELAYGSRLAGACRTYELEMSGFLPSFDRHPRQSKGRGLHRPL